MNKSYLYEIPIFYVLLALINYNFFQDSPGFFRHTLNPLWIGIFIFVFRYGLWAAIFSGITSAVYYLAMIWFLGDRFYFEDTQFYFTPSSFIIVGTALGFGIYRFQKKITTLDTNLNTVIENNRILTEESSTYQSITKELEKKVVTQMSTMATVFQGAQKLESSDFEELYTAILQFFSRMISSNQSALYIKKNNTWVLHNQIGWDTQDQWPQNYQLQEGLLGVCLSNRKIVTIKDLIPDINEIDIQQDSHRPETANLIAAPLEIKKGEIHAIFTVQNIEIIYLNSATINTLQFLIGWANRSLQKADHIQTIRSLEIIDPVLNIYSYKYFYSRLKQEFYKSKNYYLPLSICLVQLKGLETKKGAQKQRVHLLVSRLMMSLCSDSDVVAHYEHNNIDFACLLSTSSKEKSDALVQKIQNSFQDLELDIDVELRTAISHYTLKTESIDDLIQECEKELL